MFILRGGFDQESASSPEKKHNRLFVSFTETLVRVFLVFEILFFFKIPGVSSVTNPSVYIPSTESLHSPVPFLSCLLASPLHLHEQVSPFPNFSPTDSPQNKTQPTRAAMAPIQQILLTLSFPWRFIYMSLTFLPGTILRLFHAGEFSTLLSPSRLQSAWFSDFWAVAGPEVRSEAESQVVPLLEGRVHGAKVVDDAVHGGVGGTVIEVGPGSGMWVSLFSDKYLPRQDKDAKVRQRGGAAATRATGRTSVTRVYGIEPNPGVHGLLRQQVRDAGLEGVYEVVPVGIESLFASGKIAPGSVDCIVTVLCLCSIPDPAYNIQQLYQCLKPGGKWFVYEHVRYDTRRSLFMRVYQGESTSAGGGMAQTAAVPIPASPERY